MKFSSPFLILLFSVSIFSCETSNETTSASATEQQEALTSPPKAESPVSASIVYAGTGTVGTYPVSWQVQTTESTITGSYQYEGQEASMTLAGEYQSGKSVIFESDPDGDKTGKIELQGVPTPDWNGTWMSLKKSDYHPLNWVAEQATIHSPVEGWPTQGLSLLAKEVSLYTPDSLCHVSHWVWRAEGQSPMARAFNKATQPPSFQDRKVGLTDCLIAIEGMEGLEEYPPSGEESRVRLGQLVGDILPINFDLYAYIGGMPHPNYGTETIHLLLPGLQEITVDQLFTEGYLAVLDAAVTAELEQEYSEENIAYEGLPEDFHYELFADHLVIYFNPYEIGPYVLGTIEVIIPYGEIQEMIREEGPLGDKKSE